MSRGRLIGGNKGKAGFVFGAFGPGYRSVIRRPLRRIIIYGIGTGLMLGVGREYGRNFSSKLLPFIRGRGRKYLNYAGVAVSQLYNYLASKRKGGVNL
ncbi:MAG TPA: hypothetical protein GXX15_07455 [Clostridia bacterium]|nr:hypothetical protein [Clostridia bacterium]